MPRTYTAWISREGPWWVIDIPELGETTHALLLVDAERAARERIALSLGTEIDDVDPA